jgi:hypothetical protein
MPDELQLLKDMLPFLIPLVIIEVALLVIALVDLIRRENVRGDSKVVWIIVIIVFGVIGPVVYFLFGRKENPVDSD